MRSAGTLHGRPRIVRWQIQRGRNVFELLFPVSQLLFQRLILKPVPLPESEVSVLNLQRQQVRSLVLAEGIIKRCEFAKEDPNGPSVADDMVDCQEQTIFIVLESQQLDS